MPCPGLGHDQRQPRKGQRKGKRKSSGHAIGLLFGKESVLDQTHRIFPSQSQCSTSMDPPELAEAVRYIDGFLGKTLHINSRDGRLFVGTFKCVDNENNVILSTSHEYRMPTEKAQKQAEDDLAAGRGSGRADMTSRFVGLIVVPGKEITMIEVEEPQPPLQPKAALPMRTKLSPPAKE